MLLLAACAAAQDEPAKHSGLTAQLTSLGVTHETYPYLTAAVKLTNNSTVYVFVLLFGAPMRLMMPEGNFSTATTPLPALPTVSAGKDREGRCRAPASMPRTNSFSFLSIPTQKSNPDNPQTLTSFYAPDAGAKEQNTRSRRKWLTGSSNRLTSSRTKIVRQTKK